jgi:hypothetical protein
VVSLTSNSQVAEYPKIAQIANENSFATKRSESSKFDEKSVELMKLKIGGHPQLARFPTNELFSYASQSDLITNIDSLALACRKIWVSGILCVYFRKPIYSDQEKKRWR